MDYDEDSQQFNNHDVDVAIRESRRTHGMSQAQLNLRDIGYGSKDRYPEDSLYDRPQQLERIQRQLVQDERERHAVQNSQDNQYDRDNQGIRVNNLNINLTGRGRSSNRLREDPIMHGGRSPARSPTSPARHFKILAQSHQREADFKRRGRSPPSHYQASDFPTSQQYPPSTQRYRSPSPSRHSFENPTPRQGAQRIVDWAQKQEQAEVNRAYEFRLLCEQQDRLEELQREKERKRRGEFVRGKMAERRFMVDLERRKRRNQEIVKQQREEQVRMRQFKEIVKQRREEETTERQSTEELDRREREIKEMRKLAERRELREMQGWRG